LCRKKFCSAKTAKVACFRINLSTILALNHKNLYAKSFQKVAESYWKFSEIARISSATVCNFRVNLSEPPA
jgi:hypothetical protein